MNVIEISCPAKTFILGEYAALDGGSAIILNTAPRFSCRIRKSTLDKPLNLPKNSPAGQWVKKNSSDFQSVQLSWFNSYSQKGGLGFSSAQFNILYAYSYILREGGIAQIKPQEIWRNYRSLEFEGFLPSGADVISQWVGGVGVFQQNPLSVETLTSPLPDLKCLVLSTGEHFETYKYLKNFKLGDVSSLKNIANLGVCAIKQRDEESFLASVNDYREALRANNYTVPKSLEILNRLKKSKGIKACKACGAMGAETLIVFYHKQDEEEVKKACSFLDCITDESQLTYGVAFHKLTKPEEVLFQAPKSQDSHPDKEPPTKHSKK